MCDTFFNRIIIASLFVNDLSTTQTSPNSFSTEMVRFEKQFRILILTKLTYQINEINKNQPLNNIVNFNEQM